MQPLRLGLLGTGLAARKLYWPALAPLKRDIRLVACANRSPEKAQAFARETGIPTVVPDAESLFALPEVEAVLISLPIHAQPAYVLKALAAGKAVLSEKPVAPNLTAARALLKRAKPLARKVPWMVAENYRFMPQVDWAWERLAEGALGDVRLIEIRQTGITDESNPYFHTAWRTQPEFLGGFVFDAGVHLAHILRRFFGAPVEIRGLTAQFNPSLPPMDTALAAFRTSTGIVGTWTSCFSAAAGGPLFSVHGSKGSLEIHYAHALLRPRSGKERSFRTHADSYALQFSHFAKALRCAQTPAYTAEDAVADLAVIEGIIRGRVVRP